MARLQYERMRVVVFNCFSDPYIVDVHVVCFLNKFDIINAGMHSQNMFRVPHQLLHIDSTISMSMSTGSIATKSLGPKFCPERVPGWPMDAALLDCLGCSFPLKDAVISLQKQ